MTEIYLRGYNTIQYNIRLVKKIPADTAATELWS